MSEYLVDQEKYFYWILLHMYGELCIATAIMLATGSMFISYLLHTCGMFKIASYRINHAVNINTIRNITLKNKVFMIKSIICAIDIHRQAMKLSKHLVSSFEITLLCFTGGTVVFFTLNLYQVSFRFRVWIPYEKIYSWRFEMTLKLRVNSQVGSLFES
ncbi:PREDICTED: uncharacterized protein LOC108752707 [Trachymyrmex septentrionalis]|uniref:uncharacterized protein LOC108752707 n=1 Tax=Trachymyrmex septentrionalis TaxID=34720 RepID=UPI00084F7121|nr:PREDICTED: uncharacterized protein LOC108752707 [Trachymyrmex septentrionalis]